MSCPWCGTRGSKIETLRTVAIELLSACRQNLPLKQLSGPAKEWIRDYDEAERKHDEEIRRIGRQAALAVQAREKLTEEERNALGIT